MRETFFCIFWQPLRQPPGKPPAASPQPAARMHANMHASGKLPAASWPSSSAAAAAAATRMHTCICTQDLAPVIVLWTAIELAPVPEEAPQ